MQQSRRMMVLAVAALVLLGSRAEAQRFEGYTLFSPNNSRNTYLVNMSNTLVHSWSHGRTGGYSCYLLEDGSLLRSAMSSNSQLNAGGAAGVVQRVAWDGTLLWEYTYSTSTYRSHHDICPMPNGNVLLIAWEVKSASQAVQAGLDHSAAIWPDHVIEVQPVGSTGGNIVWQWHAWDHLIQNYDASKSNYGVVADHPELLNINMGSTGMGPGGGDWMHINGISYNADLDQVVISSHNLDEIYVIDHSTTTQEAASHQGGRSGKGGDILYRWGNPSNYGASGSRYFDVVHCPVWIPSGLPGAGNIMAFNNREKQGASIVVELVPPVDGSGNYTHADGSAYGPSAPVWTYTASGFYSQHLGGCQRLPNGNTLIVESTSGNMFEVNSSGSVVWSYNRGGEIVRALRYAPEYPGLKTLTDVDDGTGGIPDDFELSQNYPNPVNPGTTIDIQLPEDGQIDLAIYNVNGQLVKRLASGPYAAGRHSFVWDAKDDRGRLVASGVYLYVLKAGAFTAERKLVVMQ